MSIYSVSLKGLRDQNEDHHDIIINTNNKANPNLKKVNYYAIFDGHGGKEVSKYMQENLSKFFLKKEIEYPISKRYVYNVTDHIQQSLKEKNYAYYSGTTALAVVQFKYNNEDYLNIMNSGDCRCVLCRDNFAMPLTKDHKPNWPEERTRITQQGGKIVFDGYDWRIKDLSVSRAFGDIDATPYVTHRPDLFRYKLDKNDKFFILACDGLWDVMSNHDVTNFILLHCYDPTTKIRINKKINISRKLADYALKKGSTDNITIVIVFLE